MKFNAKIKICGIRKIEDIEKINNFNIDYIGFVFAESKRQVSVSNVCEMKKHLKHGIKTVGVFADMEAEEIISISYKSQIDIIQLHSDETDNICRYIKDKTNKIIWKSISVRNENSVFEASKFKNADGILFDTHNKNLRGGTGNPFTWDYVKGFSQNKFTILAGGIGENNIIKAYKEVLPQVIDISSSVESDGYKDYEKLKELFRRIN